MKQIVDLIPERLRSRKLAMTSTLIYLLTQLKSFGIEISPELQAALISGTGALWLVLQGLEDIVKAFRTGGIKAAVAAAAEVIKPEPSDVDKVEG